jgi:two-component system phosphate regulon sensor histidine kinase PhoR
MRIRVSWKLTLVSSAATLLVLGAAYVFLMYMLDPYIGDVVERRLWNELRLAEDMAEREPGGLNRENADALADRIGKILGVRVTIISPDGIVLGDSEVAKADLAKVENHSTRPEFQDAMRTGFGKTQHHSFKLN